MSVNDGKLIAGALACWSAFGALGAIVARSIPNRLDVAAGALRGHGIGAAILFTRLGRWYWVSAIWCGALALAAPAGWRSLAIVGVAGASQLLSQGAIALVKLRLRRVRPDYWLHVREADTSCPSGHSATAVVFYGTLCALATLDPELPRALAGALFVAAGACCVGLPWSRLALGAHYATDVLCGLLFGAGWLCATLLVLQALGLVRF